MQKMNGFMESFVESLTFHYAEALESKIATAKKKAKASKKRAKANEKLFVLFMDVDNKKRTVSFALVRNGKRLKLNEAETRILAEHLKRQTDEWDKCVKLC